ncbi:cytochrome o ubiquinol oxidase subunit IV [Pseudomonas alvandae]|uniref:Cytochrome bo(3) ubiquinol oxidase subunit 4 n=1 Tax=Pseudomonas canavaninivorans TaxID=2842348 RepID=A0ABX8QC70_PSECO|nr:cytochrome o ubiquinol oxidase subunit IV [Pseudomonas alvandae]QXI52876.1 cytochrome o ubiquinol oxidase subunit IV [Pseudomonas alvandae]
MSNLHGSVDARHGSVKSYLTGFVLSVILTVIPFALVMYPTLPKPVTAGVVAIFAVIQVVVHLIYFLHLNFSPHQRWNVTALVFSTVVIALLVGLSLWIMYSVHHNMLAH